MVLVGAVEGVGGEGGGAGGGRGGQARREVAATEERLLDKLYLVITELINY